MRVLVMMEGCRLQGRACTLCCTPHCRTLQHLIPEPRLRRLRRLRSPELVLYTRWPHSARTTRRNSYLAASLSSPLPRASWKV